jgi:carboxymethylenebutenolidase
MSDVLGYADSETREFATALAEAGITTIVPDLFRGDPWVETRPKKEYEAWRTGIALDAVAVDARLSAAELRREGLSVGMLGFCFGGGRLMDELAVANAPDAVNPDAAAVYYPTRFDARTSGRLARCPLMAVFGDKDKIVPMSVVEELQKGLGENTVMEDCELMVYDGAAHAFAHHPKSRQDVDDSEILKFQTVEWFNKHLPGTNSQLADIENEDDECF